MEFKPFLWECGQCGKRFPYQNVLKAHLRSHEDPSLLYCEICNITSSTVHNKKRHDQSKKHLELCNKQNQSIATSIYRTSRLVSTDSGEQQLPNTASGTPKDYKGSESFDHLKSRHKSTDEVSAVTQTTPKIIVKPSKPPLPEPDDEDEETLEFRYFLLNFAVKKEKIEIAASSTPFISNLGSSSSKGNNIPQPTIEIPNEERVAPSQSSSIFASDLETTQQSYMVAAPSDIESRLEIMMKIDGGGELPGNKEASVLPLDGKTEDVQNIQERVHSPTEELSVDANDGNDDLIPVIVEKSERHNIIIDDNEEDEELTQRDYILRTKELYTEGYNKLSYKNSKPKINEERSEDEDCELEDLLCNLEEQVAMLRCKLSRHHNRSKSIFSPVETELKPPNRSLHRTRQATTQQKNTASTTVTRTYGHKRKNEGEVEVEVQQQPLPAKIPNLEFYSSADIRTASATLHTVSATLPLSNEEPPRLPTSKAPTVQQHKTSPDRSSTLTGSPLRHDYKVKDKFKLTLTLDIQGTEQAGVGKRLLYYKHSWDTAEAN